MNIYIVPPWYFDNTCHVTTCYFREQAHALESQGHNVTVITIKLLSVKYILKKKILNERFWQDGNVRTYYYEAIIPIPAKIKQLQELYIKLLYYNIIKKRIKYDIENHISQPDIIHAHLSHNCGYYCLFATEKLKLPLIITEHYSGLLSGVVTKREYEHVKEAIIKSDAFIFVGSNFQKEVCKKLNINKTTYVVPNMLDVSRFNNLIKKQDDCFTFLTACTLKPNKSVDKIIIAFHNEFTKDENVKFIIAGYGTESESLKKLVKSLGEESRITFTGKYSTEETSEIFSQANVFVLTSKIETFGIVYIEAMMFGIPCIGTEGQGADDIIDRSNGLRVSYGNIPQLSSSMRYIKDNYNMYSACKIREQCIKRFSREKVCKDIDNIYNIVMKNRKNNIISH